MRSETIIEAFPDTLVVYAQSNNYCYRPSVLYLKGAIV